MSRLALEPTQPFHEIMDLTRNYDKYQYVTKMTRRVINDSKSDSTNPGNETVFLVFQLPHGVQWNRKERSDELTNCHIDQTVLVRKTRRQRNRSENL
jgi:hypothetical protein